MKTLYLECKMGAAGDMLMSALYELLPDPQGFLDTMNRLIPGVRVTANRAETCGVTGTHMEVSVGGETEESLDLPCGFVHPQSAVLAADGHVHEHEHEHEHGHEHEHEHEHGHEHEHEHEHEHSHHHAAPADIHALITKLALPEDVKKNACAVYDRIAEAESHVHGVPVTQVHFHEVGALDAVVDVTGVCLALFLLSPDAVCVSPVHLGNGQVRCAHGILPVPAPATAYLLRGLPSYSGEVQGELCTPTGAALLAHFGKSFGPMPVMSVSSIGCGIGKKVFPIANCVRAFWGDTAGGANAEIVELCCHLDDMTAEALAFAADRLMEQGALDVSSSPLTMKKGRAGMAFTVLCRPEDEERMAGAVLRETTTNGVRARRCAKYILIPSVKTAETTYGPVQVKCAEGYGLRREKPEYESVAALARENGLPFRQVWEDVLLQIKSSAGN